jgi:hypothetical protein
MGMEISPRRSGPRPDATRQVKDLPYGWKWQQAHPDGYKE